MWLVLLLLAGVGWVVTMIQARGIGGMADMPGMARGPSPALLFLPVAALGPLAEHLGPMPFGG